MKDLLFNSSKAVANMNRIEGFDPLSVARTIQEECQADQLYLDVKYRKLWFRLCNPNGKIEKKILALKENMAIVEARVYLDKNDTPDSYIASALSQKFKTDDPKFGNKFLEMAETAATGRALSDAGFGIQFADVGEENDPSQVDAGIPVQTSQEIPPELTQSYPAEEETFCGQPVSKPEYTSFGQIAYPEYTAMPPVQQQNLNQQPTFMPVKQVAVSKLAGNSVQTMPQLDFRQPVETLLSQLTYEQALAVRIGGRGANAGKTMGQIAVQNPRDLEWYRTKYNGPDNLVRAAAQILLEKAAA